MRRPFLAALALSLWVLWGCKRDVAHAAGQPAALTPAPTPPPAAPPVPAASASVAAPDPHAAREDAPEDAGPATVERVRVPKDSDASIVRARNGALARVVFLPGLCSNAYAYLTAFREAARAHGGVVAIDGDKPCGAANSDFHSFTWDTTLQRARVDAALAASGATAPEDGFTLVGYSAGASIAERVHKRWPDLFPRLVLIAPPDDPSLDRLRTARGVVSMSCSLDVPARMKNATKRLEAAGVPSIYLEMPTCTHGNISDGERLFGEAFGWLDGLPAR